MVLELLIVGAAFFGSAYLSFRPREPLPEKRCACVTDEDGYMRCEGAADARCAGGCCPTHCEQICKGRCRETERPDPDCVLQQCSARSFDGSVDRCPATEDWRCKGGNCTEHCRKHCGGACLRSAVRVV